jgi:NAD(P)-dependent dehydrogenase (short-subunit alcohol dehydrogenase family)
MRLSGRSVLVTGGATGIGRATALVVGAEGGLVTVADLNETDGRVTVAEINAAGGRACFVRCDVTDDADGAAAVAAASEFGGGLHVLIQSAGILQGAFQGIDELERAVFERVMDVNLVGTFVMCKHTAPAIEACGGGVILCIASGAGIFGGSSSLAYGASKGAVNGLCMTLENQLRPRGIRVNVVCPGSLDTPLKRQNVRDGATARGEDPDAVLAQTRLGDPTGVARVLAFLASTEADYVQGVIRTR